MGNRHSATPGSLSGTSAPTLGKSGSHHHNNRHAAAQAPVAVIDAAEARARKAQVEMHRDADRICNKLSDNSDIAQVNLLFVPVLGADIPGLAANICAEFGFNLATPNKAYSDCFSSFAQLQDEMKSDMWQNPDHAAHILRTKQMQNLLTYLPGGGANNGNDSRVSVFTQSPAEDIYVNLPFLFRPHVDRHQRLHPDDQETAKLRWTMEELRRTIDVSWFALHQRLSASCSVWVYVHMTESCWKEFLAKNEGRHSAEELRRMCDYRALLEEVFEKHDFTFRKHTVVIDVHSSDLSEQVVMHNIAQLVAEFVQDQHHQRMWRPDLPKDVLETHLSSHRYRQRRIMNAVAPSLVAGPQNSDQMRSLSTMAACGATSPSSGGSTDSLSSTASNRANVPPLRITGSASGSRIGGALRSVNPGGEAPAALITRSTSSLGRSHSIHRAMPPSLYELYGETAPPK